MTTKLPDSLLARYIATRQRTLDICAPLETEDYVVQPVKYVSPPKWHLGHTTWFFETFILVEHLDGYKVYDQQYAYVFNSYYEGAGARVMQSDRGNLSRPSVNDVYKYRAYVDEHMQTLLDGGPSKEITQLLEIGCNHEEQHQELLFTDIKYILGHNPLWPAYQQASDEMRVEGGSWLSVDAGLYEIGHDGEGFHFDNEAPRHKSYVAAYSINEGLVTNAEYLAFMEAGGYSHYSHWLSEGWQWVQEHGVNAPMYWYYIDGQWMQYTLTGMQDVDPRQAVSHVSYYEADAFARWAGKRLPTEHEWEVAAGSIPWGQRWEWTSSAYQAYPGYQPLPGTLGEYNGKFMVSQQVLRGGSVVTTPGHSRPTYRNFFHPWYRWQYTGIRLADDAGVD